jgi:hypothetical protein
MGITAATRRQVLVAGALTAALSIPACQSVSAMTFDPIPPLPQTPTPGRPGDFAFLTGEWRIHNRSLVEGAWLEYPGEATVHEILRGVGSVEELRIPARDFSGMGLRLLDVGQARWSDFWVNAKSGALTTPGQSGSFEGGVGLFWSNYEVDGVPARSIGVWDQITPTRCRWRQASSTDGGATLAHNWIMHWTRV